MRKKSLIEEKKSSLAELNALLMTAVGLHSGTLIIQLLDLDSSTCQNFWLYRWSHISVNTKLLTISCKRQVGQSECRYVCFFALGNLGMWIYRELSMLACEDV